MKVQTTRCGFVDQQDSRLSKKLLDSYKTNSNTKEYSNATKTLHSTRSCSMVLSGKSVAPHTSVLSPMGMCFLWPDKKAFSTKNPSQSAKGTRTKLVFNSHAARFSRGAAGLGSLHPTMLEQVFDSSKASLPPK